MAVEIAEIVAEGFVGRVAGRVVVGKVVGRFVVGKAVERVVEKAVGRVVVLDTQDPSPRLRDTVEYLSLISLSPRHSWVYTGENIFFASNTPIVFVIVVVVKVRGITVKWGFRRVII
jgi:hypothetical protein